MFIDDMLPCDYFLTTTNDSESIDEIDEMETIGDRVDEILRRRGRDERGEPYDRWELVAMLSGQMDAPDGKRYAITNANKSTVSKMMNNKQRWQLDMLVAICDMFDQDANWLLRGEYLDQAVEVEQFVSEEANEAGAIIDHLDTDIRTIVMSLLRSLYSVNRERRELQRSAHSLLLDTVGDMKPEDRIRAQSVLNKINIKPIE